MYIKRLPVYFMYSVRVCARSAGVLVASRSSFFYCEYTRQTSINDQSCPTPRRSSLVLWLLVVLSNQTLYYPLAPYSKIVRHETTLSPAPSPGAGPPRGEAPRACAVRSPPHVSMHVSHTRKNTRSSHVTRHRVVTGVPPCSAFSSLRACNFGVLMRSWYAKKLPPTHLWNDAGSLK